MMLAAMAAPENGGRRDRPARRGTDQEEPSRADDIFLSVLSCDVVGVVDRAVFCPTHMQL